MYIATSLIFKYFYSFIFKLCWRSRTDKAHAVLRLKSFQHRLVHNTTSAFGSTILGAVGAATGAAFRTIVALGMGTVVGNIA